MKTRAVVTGDEKAVLEDQVRADHEKIADGLVGESPEISAPVLLTVTRQYKKSGQPDGGPEDQEETISVEDFHVSPAEVEIRIGVTKNLGNFESVHVSVGLRVPCYREESAGAFSFAREFVTSRIREEIQGAILKVKTRGVGHLF
jgi:hypothetical protein